MPPKRPAMSPSIAKKTRKSLTLKVPVWVYIVSVLGGLLLLGIIVVILWKAKSEEEHLTEEGKTEQDMAPEEEEQEHIKTPVSPMLKETESAAADFEFLRA
ncbi:hypothetical protein E2C01_026731 [Portunus trituberculatus]|uniref:Uncharacterized protein n=1 Tax=Portunus trituberculatus TaxID=210409 RepID=A0A5B7EGW0_PORTR|nr:hypothetical protein [Portunus trituberculatus]